jgi:hypothetical protein
VTKLRSTSISLDPHLLHLREFLFYFIFEILYVNGSIGLTFSRCRYTRSEIAKKGSKPRILEMHSQTTDGYTYSMFASQEGTYEVVSIEDKYCGYAAGKAAGSRKG